MASHSNIKRQKKKRKKPWQVCTRTVLTTYLHMIPPGHCNQLSFSTESSSIMVSSILNKDVPEECSYSLSLSFSLFRLGQTGYKYDFSIPTYLYQTMFLHTWDTLLQLFYDNGNSNIFNSVWLLFLSYKEESFQCYDKTWRILALSLTLCLVLRVAL